MGIVSDYVRGWVADILRPVVDQRAHELAERRAHYAGTQYDNKGLRPPWTKVPPGQNPGPLRVQKPAVQYDLAKLVVDRPVALLAGEGRFPVFGYRPTAKDTDVTEVEEWLNSVAEEGELAHAGLLAARWAGSCGSAAVVWELVAGEVRFEAFLGEHCTPTFDQSDPRKLVALERKYRVTKREDGKDVDYWYRETWDAEQHVVYGTVKAKPDGSPPDAWGAGIGAAHGLGFCPALWLRLVDDPCGGDEADGIALHQGIEDITSDIDRVLGQKARAVLQNQDPRTFYFGADQKALDQLKLGGSDLALPATSNGAAVQLTEMSGEGQRVAEEHITSQRDRALETTRVVSPNPDRLLAAARSGAALRVLHGPMLEMVGELRVPFGRVVRAAGQQLVAAAQSGALTTGRRTLTPPPSAIPPGRVTVEWGDYFDATPEDLLAAAQTAESLLRAGLDDETVVNWLAKRFGWRRSHDILERVREGREGRASLLEQATKSMAAQKAQDEPQTAASAETPPTAPAPAAEAPATTEGALAAGAPVQSTALNGAQVAALQALGEDAFAGKLPTEAARLFAQIAFPGADQSVLAKAFEVIEAARSKAPPPAPAVPPPPAQAPPGAPPGGDAVPKERE